MGGCGSAWDGLVGHLPRLMLQVRALWPPAVLRKGALHIQRGQTSELRSKRPHQAWSLAPILCLLRVLLVFLKLQLNVLISGRDLLVSLSLHLFVYF